MLNKIAHLPTQKEVTPAQNCAAVRERVKKAIKSCPNEGKGSEIV